MAGELLYLFDLKHKALVYANLKTVFGRKFSPQELKHLTKEFYRAFGQNLFEIFLIPAVDKKYIAKYIEIQGREFVDEAFKKGHGVILLGVHAGSWELSNIICANLGFTFNLFVRDQRYPRLDSLLNDFREKKGCRIIRRNNKTRGLIQALKNNEAVGMTADQGGRLGTEVQFLGRSAFMPSGAVRLALKYKAVILPAYYTRMNGPHLKVIVKEPFKLKETGNLEEDIRYNLQSLMRIFERLILQYPKDYLWTYKIWKYGRQKQILILDDGRTGHLRQSQAVAGIMGDALEEKGIVPAVQTVEVKFKNKFSRLAMGLSSGLSGKYHCQGCLWCLRKFLQRDVFEALSRLKPDIIISCGSSLAAVNYVLSRDNLAKAVVVMRPSYLSTSRFDLVIMPLHDNPARRKNVLVTEGALNLIDESYLRDQAEKLRRSNDGKGFPDLCIGLLLGGDTKEFRLEKDDVSEIIGQIKSSAETFHAGVLVTTSRRTSAEIGGLVKGEFKDFPPCGFLVIAAENNPDYAVGGILALSSVVIISPESISMISEAASSGKYVIVFRAAMDKRHEEFLGYMADKKYIYLCRPDEVSAVADKLLRDRPTVNKLTDSTKVAVALKKII
ncbi:MAG: ELM1/GtrOC1 family putative glycosyltransferase [Deltaproteobacteria bacterium]